MSAGVRVSVEEARSGMDGGGAVEVKNVLPSGWAELVVLKGIKGGLECRILDYISNGIAPWQILSWYQLLCAEGGDVQK